MKMKSDKYRRYSISFALRSYEEIEKKYERTKEKRSKREEKGKERKGVPIIHAR